MYLGFMPISIDIQRFRSMSISLKGLRALGGQDVVGAGLLADGAHIADHRDEVAEPEMCSGRTSRQVALPRCSCGWSMGWFPSPRRSSSHHTPRPPRRNVFSDLKNKNNNDVAMQSSFPVPPLPQRLPLAAGRPVSHPAPRSPVG